MFFLSTGRCGTQFFARFFANSFPGEVEAVHEAFHEDYRPREFLHLNESGGPVDLDPVLENHLRHIEESLRERHYIETGWPIYGLLPQLLRRFQGKVRLVHLFRDPLRVSASLTTHEVYSRGEWTAKMSLLPSDFADPAIGAAWEGWEEMEEFEKCLFWWTAINRMAVRVHSGNPDVPWLSLRFEDVFGPDGDRHLRRLVEFAGLDWRPELARELAVREDKVSMKVVHAFDPTVLQRHPESLRLARDLGYPFDRKELKRLGRTLRARYGMGLLARARAPFVPAWRRVVRGVRRRLLPGK